MKISNKNKDKLLLTGILVAFVWLLISVVVAVVNIFAQDKPLIESYQNRPTIIRAETDEDREWNEIWRSQYREQYGVEFDEQEGE